MLEDPLEEIEQSFLAASKYMDGGITFLELDDMPLTRSLRVIGHIGKLSAKEAEAIKKAKKGQR